MFAHTVYCGLYIHIYVHTYICTYIYIYTLYVHHHYAVFSKHCHQIITEFNTLITREPQLWTGATPACVGICTHTYLTVVLQPVLYDFQHFDHTLNHSLPVIVRERDTATNAARA